MKKTLLCLALAGVAIVVTAGTAAAPGIFTCRASVVRITDNPILPDTELFVANPGAGPIAGVPAQCQDDSDSLISQTVGPVALGVAEAKTSNDQGADARSDVAAASITDSSGATVVAATGLTAIATGRCVNGQPQLGGGSSIATLNVGGSPVDVAAPPNTMIPIPLVGTLWINWQRRDTTPAGQTRVFTTRALFLESDLLGDIVVSEAISDHHGDPCP